MEVVPRAHPELLLIRLGPVARALQRLPHHQPVLLLVLVPGVHSRLSLVLSQLARLRRALRRLPGTALRCFEQVGLGRRALGARGAGAGRPQRDAGLSSVEHVQRFIVFSVRERGSGRGGRGPPRALEGAQRVAPAVRCRSRVVQRYSLLQRGGHFVQFFKVLGQPRAEDGGGEFEVVVRGGVRVCGGRGVDRAPGADDGAVLGHVDAAVNVGVAVDGGGQAAALGIGQAVLAGGAGLVLSIRHQLDPMLSAAMLETHTDSMT